MCDNIKNIIHTIFEKADISEKLYKDKKYDEIEKMKHPFSNYWKELMVKYKDELLTI